MVAQHLALSDSTLDTYEKIVESVRSFLRASRGWGVLPEGDAMECDAVQKGRGRMGKDKSKANGVKGRDSKGKGARDERDDRDCFYCGGRGHIASE